MRLLEDVTGYFYNNPDGAKAGDVVDVPDDDAVNMLKFGRAEAVKKKTKEEHAVADEESETATVESEGPPPRSAPKAAWVDHAVSQGHDQEDAESWTKDELVEHYSQ